MSWKDLRDELMQTEIFNEKAVALLKRDCEKNFICDPNIVMNLRHQGVRRNRQRLEVISKASACSRLQRLALTEDYVKLSKEKEYHQIKRDIEKFKAYLELQRNDFQKQLKYIHRNVASEVKKCARSAVPHFAVTQFANNSFSNMKTQNDSNCQNTKCSKDVIEVNETISTDDSFHNPQTQMFHADDSEATQSEETSYRKEKIAKAWKKWKTYVKQEKEIHGKNKSVISTGCDFLDEVQVGNLPQSMEICDVKCHPLNSEWLKGKLYTANQKQKRVKIECDVTQQNIPVNIIPKIQLNTVDNETKCTTDQGVYDVDDKRKVNIKCDSLEKTDESTDLESETSTKHHLLKKYWYKWNLYIHKQRLEKIRKEENQIQEKEIENISKRNVELMKLYWAKWRTVTQHRKKSRDTPEKKKKWEEKIDIFLKTVKKQKKVIHSGPNDNFVSNIPKTEMNFMRKVTHCKTNDKTHMAQKNGRDFTSKLPEVVHNGNVSFQHRFAAQQKIIAFQKSKLEEQSKIIEEMKLAQLRKEAEASVKEACKMFTETVIHTKQPWRGRNIKCSLAVPKDHEKPMLNMKKPPILLVKMAERAQERERRWQILKERKQKMEKEKLQKLQEEEEKKKEEEKNEKQKKVEELKEKRHLQQELEMAKKKERQRIHLLMLKATKHYTLKLLKVYGIEPLRKLVLIRKEQAIVVGDYFNRRLLLKYFYAWKAYVQDVVTQKHELAVTCYNLQLSRKAFTGFLMVYEEYICNSQVANDFYEFQLQKHAFLQWHSYICTQHLQNSIQLQKAVLHHKRKSLLHYLRQWKELPPIMQLEREKEKRKSIWRKKVQELLPDFCPTVKLEEAC